MSIIPKPKVYTQKWGIDHGYYKKEEMDRYLESMKAHYAPYDELLKAEPLMPLDIKSVLAKEGMPILINEGRFNELKEKAELVSIYEKQYGNVIEYAIELEHKLEAIKKEVESTLKESKEYLDTHTKPEPDNELARKMARYWLEKGFYGIALEIKKSLEAEGYPNTEAKQAKPTHISSRPEIPNPKKEAEEE